MPRRVPILLLAALCAWPGGAPRAEDRGVLPDPGETWIKVQVPDFTLISNADESDVRDIGRTLEQLREVIPHTTRGRNAQPALPVYVYVFRNEATFRPYALDERLEPTEKVGFELTLPDASFLMIRLAGEQQTRLTTCHEFTHLFMHGNAAGLPLWVDEGLAQYYETFTWLHRTARIGTVPEGVLPMLRGRDPMDLKTMFGVNWASAEYNDPEQYPLFYGQSWALVHYLLGGPAERRAQFAAYLDSLDCGLKPSDAFEKVFTADGYAQLARELHDYLYRDEYHLTRYEFSEDIEAASTAVDTLSRAEALWRLGELLAHRMPVHHPAARAHFEAALSADPACGPACAGLGLLAETAGDTAEAARWYSKAVALAPEDPSVLLRCAHYWLGRASAERASDRLEAELPPPARAARELLGRCLALRPGNIGALALLGRTYRYQSGDLSPGVDALRRACEALPARTDLLVDLICLTARAGDRAGARALVDSRLRERAGVSMRRDLLEWITGLDAQAARPADSGSVAAGPSTSGAAGAPSADPDPAPPGTRVLPGMSRAAVLEHQRYVRIFNQAVDAANARETDKALRLFTLVADSANTADLRAQARACAGRVHARVRVEQAHSMMRAGRLREGAQLLEAVVASGEADSAIAAFCRKELLELKPALGPRKK